MTDEFHLSFKLDIPKSGSVEGTAKVVYSLSDAAALVLAFIQEFGTPDAGPQKITLEILSVRK